MKLAAYLEQENLTPAAFAKKMGVGRATVWRWANGDRTPNRRKHLDKIARATGGQVTVSDFFPVPKTKARAEARI